MLSVAVAVCPNASVTVYVTLVVPGAVGVPVNSRVLALNDSPVGSALTL